MNGGSSFRFRILTLALFTILAALFIFPVLIDCGLAPKDGKGNTLTFWLLWELLSIVVTFAVTIAFWYSIFWGGSDGAAMDGAKGNSGFLGTIALLFFMFGFGGAAFIAYFKGALGYQVLCLFVGVAATVLLQILALRGIHERLGNEHQKFRGYGADQATQKKECAELVRHKLGERDNLAKYLCFSDMPIAFAFFILVIFVWGYSAFGYIEDETVMRTFVAGAVAVQLLYSNLVFWLESYAQTDSGYQFLGRLPPSLHAIRAMLRPEEDLSSGDVVSWVDAELQRIFEDRTY
ncbi:MAG: hypothetical protein H6985_06285 [Pseudomonadales bacterium]|nr:hypothetical protein [Pseudomonadales bacterium]